MNLQRPGRMPVGALLGASVFALLLAVALAAAFMVAHWDAREQAVQAETALDTRVAFGAAAVGDLLEGRLRLLALVASMSPPDAPAPKAGRDDRSASAARPGTGADASVAWVDAQGRVVLASTALRAGEDVSARPWFTTAVGGPVLSEELEAAPRRATPAQAAADWALQAVVPLHDAQRRVASLVVSPIDCVAIARQLDRTAAPNAAGPARHWAIVGRDGGVRCATPGFARQVHPEALTTLSPGAATAWHRPEGGATTLLANHRIEGSDALKRLGWRLVAAQAAAPTSPWQSGSDAQRALLAGVGASLLAMPFVMLLARRLGSPLARLAASLDRARTEFDYDPERIPVEGPREAAAVGEAARSMLRQISAQQLAMDASATGYRELFELHPLPMWVVDEASLRFLEVNAAAVRKYGWRRDEFLSMTVLEIRPPESASALVAAFEDTRMEEHHTAVWQHRLRAGDVIDVEVASRQLRWGGCAARIAVAMDVTLQRRASLQLQRQRRDVSQLAQKLMTTEAAERRELAQVLHDRFAPTLYGAKLSLEALRSRSLSIEGLPDLRSEVARVVAPLVQALDGSIADTRGLMSDLRPPLLVEHGLAAALAHEAERQGARDDSVQIVMTRGGEGPEELPPRHDSGVEYALFMIAHEALHNALRHAQASHLSIGLNESVDGIRLIVSDDGVGFDSDEPPPIGHLGLVGMKERAHWIGAEFTINTVRGVGTTIGAVWRRAEAA
jgi:PAS domain S-box-containing protein